MLLLTLWGCAAFPPPLRVSLPETSPGQTVIPSVPFFAQEAYQCGPAAMAMVLTWSGLQLTPDELTPLVYTPERRGSLQPNLIGAARRHGRLSYPITGIACLLSELAAGHPVIVLQNLGLRWLPQWHYAVAIGYDQKSDQIILHTGLIAHRRVKFTTFQRTWLRAGQWGLVVLPPSELPACAEEASYLKASLGLQQAGQLSAAAAAFGAAAQHWPDSSTVHVALGNCLYRLGHLEDSAEAFRRAINVQPQNGAAYNNLAQVLLEMGNLEEAEAAAERAVGLGGRHADLFRKTLEDIRRRAISHK